MSGLTGLYLRRDADIGGFLFWLGQVNSAPLRELIKQRAMVCSFITSAQYHQQFSLIVTRTNNEFRTRLFPREAVNCFRRIVIPRELSSARDDSWLRIDILSASARHEMHIDGILEPDKVASAQPTESLSIV